MRKTSGISLMLLIFLSLCLITFSLLSLSGAAADQRLSRKAADRTTEYYAASNQANGLVARIDGELAACFADAEDEEAYRNAWQEIPKKISEVSQAEDGLSFSVQVKEEQILYVELTPAYPQAPEDTLYQIAAWKIINTAEWEPDQSMNLYRSSSDSPE